MRRPNDGDLKFSILVVVHDKLEPLKKCMESLRNQTYPNYEIIVIDDESSDETKYYLQFLEQIDSKIKLSRNVNRIGKGASKNLLLDQAVGDYFIFVEPTDYVETDLLEKLNNSLKNNQVDILHYNSKVEGGTPEQIQKEYNRNPYRYNEIPTGIITGEEALLKWIYNKDQTTTTPWSYCVKEYLYDDVSYPKKSHFEDIPIIPTLLAKAKTAKGIDYVGYHFMQYDQEDKNLSEYEKCLALAKKLSVFRKMVEELKDNLSKTNIDEEIKQKIIKDFEKRYETRKDKLINRNKDAYQKIK